ncbi:unnamed protein product [Lymnaea stagnalis]|uniref:Uncharacterized protein n=1 Tax=Lymnaea stagnalis TaxID=6523 RepID=A0AAV2HIT2_LYMST
MGESQDSRGESQDNRGESQDSRGESQDKRGESQDNMGESQDSRVETQDSRGETQDIESMPNNNQVMTRHEADDVVEDGDVAMVISIETTDDFEDDADNDNKNENSTPVVELLLVKPPAPCEGREDLEDVHYPKSDVPCQYKEGVGSFSPRTNTNLIPNDVIEYLDRMKQENEDLKLRLAGKDYDLEMLKKLTNASSEIIANKDKEIYFLQSDLELMRCNLSADQNKDTQIQELQERLNNALQLSREKDEKISQLEDEIQNLRSVGVQQGNPHTALDPRPADQSAHEDSQDLSVKSKTCTVM